MAYFTAVSFTCQIFFHMFLLIILHIWDSLTMSSIQCVCLCVLTMTTILSAGIKPITGKRRGSEATQNSLSWLSIGLSLLHSQQHCLISLLCQKQRLCVVWRVSIPRRCLEWEALPGADKKWFLSTKNTRYPFFLTHKPKIC